MKKIAKQKSYCCTGHSSTEEAARQRLFANEVLQYPSRRTRQIATKLATVAPESTIASVATDSIATEVNSNRSKCKSSNNIVARVGSVLTARVGSVATIATIQQQ